MISSDFARHTRCTVIGIIVFRAPSSIHILGPGFCIGVVGYGTPPCFKERSHSPGLSFIPLAGCTLSHGELGTNQLNGCVPFGLCVSLWLQSAV